MSTQADKANLARIRDNQRRSRARRKEYLQDLEQRVRNCELVGVEASTEIQAAARKVIEENRRLRSLLSIKGVDSHQIEQYLAGNNEAAIYESEAPVLDILLNTRKGCDSQSKTGKGRFSKTENEHSSRDQSVNELDETIAPSASVSPSIRNQIATSSCCKKGCGPNAAAVPRSASTEQKATATQSSASPHLMANGEQTQSYRAMLDESIALQGNEDTNASFQAGGEAMMLAAEETNGMNHLGNSGNNLNDSEYYNDLVGNLDSAFFDAFNANQGARRES